MSDKLPSYLEQLLALCYVCCLFIMVGFYSGTVKYCQVIWLGIHSWNHVVGGKSYGIQKSNNKKSLIRNIQFYLPSVLPHYPPTSPIHTLTSQTQSRNTASNSCRTSSVFSTFSPVLCYNLRRIFMWVLVTWHDDKLCNRIVPIVTKTLWLLSLWWISTDGQQDKWRLYLVLASVTDGGGSGGNGADIPDPGEEYLPLLFSDQNNMLISFELDKLNPIRCESISRTTHLIWMYLDAIASLELELDN